MKVGDYVRTKKYGIKKILDIGEYLGITQYLIDEDGTYIIDNSIIKSSSNIIDLIEVGDYVNGHRVIDFMLKNGKRKGIIVDADIWGFDIDEIKSIVTKEQFSSMEYRINE